MSVTVGVLAIIVPGVGRLETKRGTKLNPGGIARNVVKSDYNVHYAREIQEATIEGTLVHRPGDDITSLNKIADVTITVEADTGESYMVRNAFATEPNELTAGEGEVTFKFAGDPAVRV